MSSPVDTKPEIEEACRKNCMAYQKAYDECVVRVQGGHGHGEAPNCQGQYFDLWHCIDACAANKIFAKIR